MARILTPYWASSHLLSITTYATTRNTSTKRDRGTYNLSQTMPRGQEAVAWLVM